MEATEKALSLGATIKGGINWTWALGLSLNMAKEFIVWLNDNEYDHRGIYTRNDVYDVRYR